MYRTIINIKKNVPDTSFKELIGIANKAFDNKAGKVVNVSSEPYCLEFGGNEKDFGCLNVGMRILRKNEKFFNSVDSWQWIDEEDPDESCNMLEVFSMPVR